MKNQTICQTNLVSESINYAVESVQHISLSQVLWTIRQWILGTRPFMALAGFVSSVLGEQVSPLKSFNLLHAFVSFFAMLLLGGNSLLVQFLLIVWFALAALQCKRDGWASNGKE